MTRKSRIVSIDSGSTPNGEEDVLLLETVMADPDSENAPEQAEYEGWVEEDAVMAPRRHGWIAPALAGLGIAAWTGFFVWAHRFEADSLSVPSAWINWISQWSLPVLLIGIAWLLMMRTSKREAARFGDVSRLLSHESALLEGRLATINSELSIAREFIAAQSRDLESLGRMASERLSENASKLASLISDNGDRVETIASVSTTALDNMEKLRGQLPVIASSARDVTNHIGNAGRTAHAQLQELMQGFKRLNEFGLASEQHVGNLREQVGMALAEFTSRAERFEEMSRDSFSGLSATTAEFRERLDRHHAEAVESMRKQSRILMEELDGSRVNLRGLEETGLDAIRKRLESLDKDYDAFADKLAQGEAGALETWRSSISRIDGDLTQVLATLEETDRLAMEKARARLTQLISESERLDIYIAERTRLFSEEMERRSSESDEREQADIARMQERLSLLDEAVTAHAAQQDAHARSLETHGETLAARLDDLQQRIQDIADQGADATTGLSRSMHILDDNVAACRAVLATTDEEIGAATDSSVRLLELLQASAQQGQEALPNALAQGEDLLLSLEQRMADLNASANDTATKGKALAEFSDTAAKRLTAAQQSLADLSSGLDDKGSRQGEMLERLQASLKELEERNSALIARSESELGAAMAALATGADATSTAIRAQSEQTLAALSGSVETEVRAALDRAIRDRLAEVAGELDQATQRAAVNGREAVVQLRDHLAKVSELAGNLEQRVSQARQRAEEQVDNDFARRVALITETLNSNAIDIVRAIDSEVSDTAWASYLRGDRGIFTRRAVKLLEAGEARPIAQLYQSDPEFREQVSRYIHDFEGMLRQVLSTRDGNALGVTLLSSDMGKLYVAMAQAIERLRS